MIQNRQDCVEAIDLALEGEWDKAPSIVQEIETDYAQWIHAVLHKIEGDIHNSRYWYNRSGLKSYESYKDPDYELSVIKDALLA